MSDRIPTAQVAEETSEGCLLLSVEQIAALLGVSTRTVWRLASTFRMPQPLRLGRVVRWRSKDISIWVEAGCTETGHDQH